MNMFACPTSSATKALAWFELRSGGLRVLAFGLGLAVMVYVLFALAVPYKPFRIFSIFAAFGTPPLVLLLFGRNAFGIRRDKKRAPLSAFELTQPSSTVQLVSVKLLVRAACVVVALAIIGAGVWASLSMLSEWGPWVSKNGKDMREPLLALRVDMAGLFGGSWYELPGHVFNFAFFVLGVVATFATLAALWARYPRQTLITGSLLILAGFALGVGDESMPLAIRRTIPWTLLVALVITIALVIKSGFAERALTTSYLLVAVALAVANLVAYLPGNEPPIGMGEITRQFLLPVLVFVLAPWSFGRLRHT